MLCLHNNYFKAGHLQRRSTALGLLEKIKNPKIIFDSFLVNKIFQLEEDGDDRPIKSAIFLNPRGEIQILNGPSAEVRGRWSIQNGEVFRMVLERTFNGKYVNIKVLTHFAGILEEDYSGNMLIISGEICDEIHNSGSKNGRFCMIPYHLH